MKKSIKRISEEELMMAKAVCDFHPFARNSVLIDKGDMKAPDWNSMLDWEDSFPDWWDEDEDEAIPMKDMKRQERRKYRFTKDMVRLTRAHNLGYNLSIEDNPSKVRNILSASHVDKAYFRGNKAKKKMGKPITTKTALDLVEQMKWEAEMDREAEYKEAERQFALDELASMKDDFKRLSFSEDSLIESMANLIDTINEAQNQLDMLEPRLNGLMKAKEHLRAEIAKLEEVVNG